MANVNRKLYIMGAGSSVVAGAPVIADFKQAASQLVPSIVSEEGKERFSYALKAWDMTLPHANIEEFYIAMDLLQRLGINKPVDTRFAPEDVRYLIAKTLAMKVKNNGSTTHKRFVHKVYEQLYATTPLVITLNWDMALDIAALSTHDQFTLDYCYDESKPVPGTPYPSERPRRVKILKLHGSINWLFCSSCRSLWFSDTPDPVMQYWEGDQPVCFNPSCNNKLRPLMLPPTSQKLEDTDSTLVMKAIWKEARSAISSFEEIVFVGYSFPPTDIQFKMHVVEALSKNKNLKRISIVTPKRYGSLKVEFEDHYARVFDSSLGRVPLLNPAWQTFEEWVEGQMEI